jgi:hypothetical protein
MATIRKRGLPRKSRRARMNMAMTSVRLDWKPTVAVWRTLEMAYVPGFAVTDADQTWLKNIVRSYLVCDVAERHAFFADDVRAKLAAFGKAVDAFGLALDSWCSGDYAVRGPFDMIWRNLTVHSQPSSAIGLTELDDVISLVGQLSLTIRNAREALEEDIASGAMVEGRAWQSLILSLTAFAAGRGLPTGAPKDSDKRDTPAPFVNFVMALVASLPAEARRHSGTWQACAQAISQARRTSRLRKQ